MNPRPPATSSLHPLGLFWDANEQNLQNIFSFLSDSSGEVIKRSSAIATSVMYTICRYNWRATDNVLILPPILALKFKNAQKTRQDTSLLSSYFQPHHDSSPGMSSYVGHRKVIILEQGVLLPHITHSLPSLSSSPTSSRFSQTSNPIRACPIFINLLAGDPLRSPMPAFAHES